MIAVMLCVALCSAASAASYENLSADEIAAILGVDVNELSDLEDLASNLGKDTAVTTAPDAGTTASAASDALGGIGEILGGVDISAIAGSLSGGDDTLSSITSIFESIDLASFDFTALTDMISGVFGGSGIDLASLTSGLDLGSFDIASLLGGLGGSTSTADSGSADSSSSAGDAASGATDMMSGIMDGLMSGLTGLGIDTSMIEGLLDNDIVNFFANLYIGLGGADGGEVTTAVTTTAVTTTAPTTTKPVVVTTSTPKTGDTSAVVAAIATLSVAAGAAFVCLKKKEA